MCRTHNPQFRSLMRPGAVGAALLVIALTGVLLRFAPVEAADTATDSLPEHVAEMRNAILDAASTGKIDAMGVPIEMNELPPVFDAEGVSAADPVAALREMVPGGDESALLRSIMTILEMPSVRDGDRYVWPYLAKRNLNELTAEEQNDLKTAMSGLKRGEEAGGARYTGYRLEIGGDGTWHYFGRPASAGE